MKHLFPYFAGIAILLAFQGKSFAQGIVIKSATSDSIPAFNVNRASSLVISGETVICPGTLTALKVEGQYKAYQWSTGHMTPNVTIFKPGTYSVTVTTQGGCELTGSVTVRYSSSPCL